MIAPEVPSGVLLATSEKSGTGASQETRRPYLIMVISNGNYNEDVV